MWVYFYRNKKRSEICKWENRYAKHFPIYFGSSWMERKLGRFGSRDLKFQCRVNFHILLLFLELDSLPLGTLGNGSFAPHYSLFSKKAKVAPTSLNWIQFYDPLDYFYNFFLSLIGKPKLGCSYLYLLQWHLWKLIKQFPNTFIIHHWFPPTL